MSAAHLARGRAISNDTDRMRRIRSPMVDFGSMAQTAVARDFDPCDATASYFLYAQGSSVVCCRRDTLAIERRFSRHTEEIQLLAVDNVSERGAGRLVISYDAGQTAIVWDLMTGDEIARFVSYSNLTVASWMRNGNVAFGNSQGNVILFEPITSEHISARTIDQIPITALAPSADCRTYAIGYKNGSLLICTLQPRFTIMHNLTTSRGPSPIATLAWHASSSKQKSDMLASQTEDGDLRVWSVAKNPSSSEPAKVVRNLGRAENRPGKNWLGWSKGGRIIQHCDGETTSWDVRTKLVSNELVPTLDVVRGIALYGPSATLFTLGPNNTAQQFDLNSPPVLVAKIQHPANLLPPSPPVSIEEQKSGTPAPQTAAISSIPINIDMIEPVEDPAPPFASITKGLNGLREQQPEQFDVPSRSGALSPASSQYSFTSRSSSASLPYAKQPSIRSASTSDHTMMSFGSSIRSKDPSIMSGYDGVPRSNVSTSTGYKHRGRSSRLKQEILRSPEEAKKPEDTTVHELFRFTKSRLSDVPYTHPAVLDNRDLTNNDLRRQMLSTIFGWDGEAEDLIRDEMSRHPIGTTNRLLLTKWLGDLDTDIMTANSDTMTSTDWMLLAFSGISGQSSQQKVARAYVQRLLEKGDVHSATTIMIGMGDQNDAIEVYVSHQRYMEALILMCFVYPQDWGRQSELVRKWGEWAILHNQEQLAVRCFSCSGAESSEPWFSPSAQDLNFPRGILGPPLSPPTVNPQGSQRNMAKTHALKLVTSFGDQNSRTKLIGTDDDRTPMNAAGITPIADSAITPIGKASSTRPSQRSLFSTPASARTITPGGFAGHRLPSIGETPTDVVPAIRRAHGSSLSVSGESASEASEDHSETGRGRRRGGYVQSPMIEVNRSFRPLPSPALHNFTQLKQESRSRNGSRDRKPIGLQIQSPSVDSILTNDLTTPELTSTSSVRPTRSVAGSVSSAASGRRSPFGSERRHRSNSVTSPVVTGRSLDPYISSLESAQYTKPHRERGRSSSHKLRGRELSRDRDRSDTQFIKPAKRSPTSPIPMSPDEYRGIGGTDDDPSEVMSNISSIRRVRDGSQSTAKPGSKASSRIRRISPEPSGLRTTSRTRQASPDTAVRSRHGRGRSRSQARDRSISPEARFQQAYQDDDDDLRAAQADHERFRSRQRSVSRVRERGASAARNASPERRTRYRSTSRQPSGRDRSEPGEERRAMRPTASHDTRERDTRERAGLEAGDLSQIKDERQRKKEAAARELEERRRSLASRPSAPPIIHPEELSPIVFKEPSKNFPSPSQFPPRSQTTPPQASGHTGLSDGPGERPTYQVHIGLPATPRAMQHPKYDPDSKDIPEVPLIPNSYTSSQQSKGSLDEMARNAHEIAPLPKSTFMPLPKTVYQAPTKPGRSMSVPILEEPLSPDPLPAALPTHPAFQATLPPSTRHPDSHASTRRVNTGDAQPGTIGYDSWGNSPVKMGGIDETMEHGATLSNHASHKGVPSSPSPPPKLIDELQHLARPTVPPPGPLHRHIGSYVGNSQPANVEVLKEDGTFEPVVSPSRNSPEKVEPPPRTGSVNHSRGRSVDNSFASRLTRATERIRSVSRGASPQLTRTKSPPSTSPYESIPTTTWSPDQSHMKSSSNVQYAIERHPREVKAGMMDGMI